MPKKQRIARHWVTDTTGQEIGPFIEEADARLCRAALAIFAEDREWSVAEHD
jgi:hypothetical protein